VRREKPSVENWGEDYLKKYFSDWKLLILLLLVAIFAYGGKLFFYTLASDDYGRFYSEGREQASWLGRWMAGIFNEHIFTQSLQILPYFNGLIGVVTLTLTGYVSAGFFAKMDRRDKAIFTLLIVISPFFGHNLYFNTNISVWITTFIGVVAVTLLYERTILQRVLGVILLVVSVGTYQTIVQVALVMVVVKALIELTVVDELKTLKQVLCRNLLVVLLIVVSFFGSLVINYLYIEYNHLTRVGRFKRAESNLPFSIYMDRVVLMYKNSWHLFFRLNYFQEQLTALYKIFTLFALVAFIKNLLAKKLKVQIATILILLLIILAIPLVLYAPLITGNTMPTRAHYSVGWLLAGFFLLQITIFRGFFKTLSYLLAASILVVSAFYISVFYDAAYRQTAMDITRANQIVNRIRSAEDYINEPVKFKIVGERAFMVKGWSLRFQQALQNSWSQYTIFTHFTDLKFLRMSDKEYKEVEQTIVQKGALIEEYPGYNSIVLYKGKAVLFLDSSEINAQIKLANFPSRAPDLSSKFDIYIENGSIYYKKTPCSREDIKDTFFLHVYPKEKVVSHRISKKSGIEYMDFPFGEFGKVENGSCSAVRELPKYEKLKVATGQFTRSKILWSAVYSYPKGSVEQK
jgi:hypothetical protein